jgi:hypothetical protein
MILTKIRGRRVVFAVLSPFGFVFSVRRPREIFILVGERPPVIDDLFFQVPSPTGRRLRHSKDLAPDVNLIPDS